MNEKEQGRAVLKTAGSSKEMILAQQECSSLEEGGGAQIVSSSIKSKVVDKAGKERLDRGSKSNGFFTSVSWE